MHALYISITMGQKTNTHISIAISCSWTMHPPKINHIALCKLGNPKPACVRMSKAF